MSLGVYHHDNGLRTRVSENVVYPSDATIRYIVAVKFSLVYYCTCTPLSDSMIITAILAASIQLASICRIEAAGCAHHNHANRPCYLHPNYIYSILQ